MSNESFFLELCRKEFLTLYEEEPTEMGGGVVRYEFSYFDGDLPYFIYFNQIGGFYKIEKAY